MYPVFVVIVVLALCAVVSNLTLMVAGRTDDMRAERIRVEQTRIAEGVDRYIVETGTFPESLDELVDAQGFEELRGVRNPWQGLEASGTLQDSTWQFQRVAAWSVRRPDGGASYRAENACGSGDVSSATSWCGMQDGVWYRHESREDFAAQLTQQRARQQRTLQMLADHWSAYQAFPQQGNDGAVLVPGQMRSLAALAGYAGASTNCTGIYVWRGIPLDCGALFDVWGSPVGYQYQSTSYVVLASESPIRTAAGTRMLVSTPLQIQE